MNRRRRQVAAVTIVLLATAMLSWLCLAWREELAPSSLTGPALVLQWRDGHSQQYRCRVDSTVVVTAQGNERLDPINQAVDGVLELQTLEVAADAVTVGMRLSPVDLRVGEVADAATNLALASPFRVRFARSGLPVAFAFPSAVGPQHRGLLEELVRTFQLVVRGEPAWAAEERHGTGTYEAQYVREGTDQVRRTKLRYLAPTAAPDSPRRVQVVASQASVRIDPAADWIASMSVQETLLSTDESGPAFEVTTRATLALLPAVERAATSSRSLWQFPAVDPAVAASAPRTSPLSERYTDQLEAELADLVAALDAAREGRVVWIHRLRDLLLADQRTALLLLGVMRARELGDRTRADLFLAFELGGTVEAQAALGRVVAEPSWSHRDRARALVALGGVARPTEASLSALWATARDRSSGALADHANTATLALGALGSKMAAEQNPDYANLRDGLLSAALGAQDAHERAIVVTALGNIGDAKLVPEIVPFLDDQAPEVRRVAAKTLGKLGTEIASIEIVLRLRQEANSAVRAAMAAALVSCEAPPAEAMELIRGTIGMERDEVARLELARCLGRNLGAHPENGVVLRNLLATEQSKQVRRYVGEVLARAEADAGSR